MINVYSVMNLRGFPHSFNLEVRILTIVGVEIVFLYLCFLLSPHTYCIIYSFTQFRDLTVKKIDQVLALIDLVF